MKIFFYTFFIFLSLAGCKKAETDAVSEPQAAAAEVKLSAPSEDNVQAEKQYTLDSSNDVPETAPEQKIIKTAHITFEVKNLAQSNLHIKKLIQNNNGYITRENTTGSENQPENHYEIRLPTSSFDAFITQLSEEVAYFDRKEISRTDVTEEFLDVEARLKTKKELELRYLDILKRASKVSEILEVERELNNVRQEVESMAGRLKYLQHQVSLSTVNLTIYKSIPYKNTDGKASFFSRLGTSFVNGFHNAADFIIALMYLWPFIILSGILLFWLLKIRKKRKQKV